MTGAFALGMKSDTNPDMEARSGVVATGGSWQIYNAHAETNIPGLCLREGEAAG